MQLKVQMSHSQSVRQEHVKREAQQIAAGTVEQLTHPEVEG